MALKRGTTTALPDTVAEVPDEIPRGRGGRPKIRALVPDPDGPHRNAAGEACAESETRTASYTRASTLGKTIKDLVAVNKWKLRKVAEGMALSKALVLRAAAVEDPDGDGRDELDSVAEAAIERAAGNDGATQGTALHKLSEQLDAGRDLSHLPDDALAALNRYRELMSSVRVVAAETFVVNDALEAAGTYDRLVELLHDVQVGYMSETDIPIVLPAGMRVILDLKTNKTAKYFGPDYSAQQTVYGTGTPYTHAHGRGEWPDGIPPTADWALILHVPIAAPEEASFYWVNLTVGAEHARLANQVREECKRTDVFIPTDLAPINGLVALDKAEAEHERENWRVILLERIEAADSLVAIDVLYDVHRADWQQTHTDAAIVRRQQLQIAQQIQEALHPGTLDDLYVANEAHWTPELTALVVARLAEMDAQPVAS